MNERILARLEADGAVVRMDQLSNLGIILNGETSAWPRGIRLMLKPSSRAAEERYRVLAMQRDWRNGEFVLKTGLLQDGMVISEGEGGNISARWDLGLRVEDLKGIRRKRVVLPEDGEAQVTLKGQASSRRIQLKPKNVWGREICRIVEVTRLDDMAGEDWLNDSSRRATRQSCLLNILAVCQSLGLIEGIKQIIMADVDRLYAEVEPGFGKRIKDSVFNSDDRPGHSTHERLVKWVVSREGASQEEYLTENLLSFRQDRNPSLQVVTLPSETEGLTEYAEFDIDFGNIFSLPGFFIHTFEVLLPDRTDHFKVYKKLLKKADVARHLIHQPQG